MKTTQQDFGRYIDGLLEVLDQQAHWVELSLVRLDYLRQELIKRDEAGLLALLETIRAETGGASGAGGYRDIEFRQRAIRSNIAVLLGCSVGEVNLSRICQYLDEGQKAAVSMRQQRLLELMARLRREHTATMLLLAECSRLNSLILNRILGSRNGVVTYNGKASLCRDKQWDAVDMRM